VDRSELSKELLEVLEDLTISPKEYHRQRRLAKDEIEEMEDSATWEYRHQRRRRLAKDEIEELEYLTISPKECRRQRCLAKKEITVVCIPHLFSNRNTPIFETPLFSKPKHPYF
jgi:putative ubiquitin-RnfH superfamily antitoxin RatB of RatAB toxin-antitoxin module